MTPDNHIARFWTPGRIAEVTGGQWLRPPTDPAAPLAGLSTDTRSVQPGQVFLALRGEHFDAHDFLAQAQAAGAGLLVVCDSAKAGALPAATAAPPAAGVLLVPDTLAALQQLAAAYRDVLAQAGTRVIAVAGSNGKTTTRSLIHAVLSARFRGTQSPKSFNNHIGVPLTILASGRGPGPADDFLVVEVGTNHPGEIAALAALVRPDAAVITSIGHEHLAFFGSLAAVAQEEAAILGFLRPGGLAVVNGDAPELAPILARLGGLNALRFGRGPECGARLLACQVTAEGTRFTYRTAAGTGEALVPLPGEHNALNALAALAVGRWMGLEPAAMHRALAAAAPPPMRMQVQVLGAGETALTLLNDAYNANPSSVQAALATLAGLPGRRRVAILGDMLELGGQAPDLHRAIGALLAETPAIERVLCVGRLALFVAEGLARTQPARVTAFPEWSDDLPMTVAAALAPGDVVLVKASRGMRLERLLPAITARFAAGRP